MKHLWQKLHVPPFTVLLKGHPTITLRALAIFQF